MLNKYSFSVLFSIITLSACTTQLPGQTITNSDITTQQNILPIIKLTTSKAVPECHDYENYKIINTEITRQPEKNQDSENWDESWTILACGQKLSVPINFYQSNLGSSLKVDYENIKKLQ